MDKATAIKGAAKAGVAKADVGWVGDQDPVAVAKAGVVLVALVEAVVVPVAVAPAAWAAVVAKDQLITVTA